MPAISISLPPLTAPQMAIKSSAARFRVVAAGRRFGKSRLACLLCLEVLLTVPDSVSWWLAPVYAQADQAWSDLKALARNIPGTVVRESDRKIVYGGSHIQIKTATEPDTLRGSGLNFVVLDEAAFMDAAVWQSSIRPALSDRKGKALLISSPNGSGNWFHLIYLQGLTDVSEWQSWRYPTSANPYIDPAEIESAKLTQPAIVFAQEYLADFTDDSGRVFRNIKSCLYKGGATFQKWAAGDPHERAPFVGQQSYFVNERHHRRHYSMGCDFAQIADFTVLVVTDQTTGQVVDIDRFNQISWEFQRTRLKQMAEKWDVSVIWAESNSIGSVNIEALQQEGLPVRAFTTTNASKSDIIQALAFAIETQKIKLPSDHKHSDVLLAELEGFQADRLPSGRWRYAAPSNLHDDCVMALALSWHGAKHRPSQPRFRKENPIYR